GRPGTVLLSRQRAFQRVEPIAELRPPPLLDRDLVVQLGFLIAEILNKLLHAREVRSLGLLARQCDLALDLRTLPREPGYPLLLQLQPRNEQLRSDRRARRLGEVGSDATQLGHHVVERRRAVAHLSRYKRGQRHRGEYRGEGDRLP